MNTTPFILACSGPGAAAAIRNSITIGYVCAAFGGVATLVLACEVVRTRTRWGLLTLPLAGLLMFVHPAWTVSAIRGDCGSSKREISYIFTAIFIGLLIFRYMTSRRAV